MGSAGEAGSSQALLGGEEWGVKLRAVPSHEVRGKCVLGLMISLST